jgi:hypothetical protein
MVVIGFDRYNVIVKGFSGTKITGGRAAGILVILWAYSIIGCFPPFLGWGGYALGEQKLNMINIDKHEPHTTYHIPLMTQYLSLKNMKLIKLFCKKN